LPREERRARNELQEETRDEEVPHKDVRKTNGKTFGNGVETARGAGKPRSLIRNRAGERKTPYFKDFQQRKKYKGGTAVEALKTKLKEGTSNRAEKEEESKKDHLIGKKTMARLEWSREQPTRREEDRRENGFID